MKALYLVYNKLGSTGIDYKINSQLISFKKNGVDISIHFIKDKKIPLARLIARLPFTNTMPQWILPPNLEEYDFIYMRRPGFMSLSFLRFLRSIKRIKPSIIIFMEVPTFPYDKEYTSRLSQFPFYLKDKIARRKLKGLVDYIPELGNERHIFGVETVKIYNGYDFNSLRIKKNLNLSEISIIAVARFCEWHGYERLISGLHYYYHNGGTRKIVLHFVGDGKVLDYYKSLVKKYDLHNNVIFHGYCNRDYISELYDQSNLAVDVLGGYKKDLKLSCSLKTREYAAAGLPIIGATPIDLQDINDLQPFILLLPDNSTPIDFNTIITFYDHLYNNPTEFNPECIASIIRCAAYKHLNCDNSMDSIVSAVREGVE